MKKNLKTKLLINFPTGLLKIVVGLIVFSSSLFSIVFALSLTELQQRLSQDEVIRASFSQKRYIKDLSEPLASQGKLLVSKAHGLYWGQEKPFKLTILLTENTIVQQVNNGPVERITARQNPQVFQFSSLLFSLFHLDEQKIEQNFTLSFSDLGKGKWAINLIPKRAPLNKIFKEIDLKGGRFVENVSLLDQAGDRTDIIFSQHSQKALTDDERAKFEP